MKHTELDLIVAELMFPILVDLAPSGNTIGYKEIADLIKSRNPDIPEIANITQRHIGRKLGTVWEFTKEQGCPHIGSLVVLQGGDCGTGISSIVSDLPGERERVKTFDWSSVSLGFSSYITKAKIQKSEREEKRVKLTKEEANERYYAYWKSIKEEAPISRNEALKLKDSLISKIQDGFSPEESFALELMKLFREKKKEPELGYVYIGEYLDSQTKKPLFNQLKIGYTSNIKQRAAALGGGVIGPLEFCMNYYWEFESNFAYAIEQALHGKFARYRASGEFFTDSDGLLVDLVDDEITSQYGDLLKSSSFE